MNLQWKSLPLRRRLFIAFGSVLALAMLLALGLQSRAHSESRIESLLEQELPTQLEKLASQLSLRLTPGLAVSESLANSYFIEQWVRQGLPEERHDEVIVYLERLQQQLEFEVLFIAAQYAGRSHYYQLRDGELAHRLMQPPGKDDDWYHEFLARQVPYELNLDADTFTPEDAFMFLNFSSRTTTADGKPLVVAGAGLDVSRMASMVETFQLGETGRAALLNAEGKAELETQGTLVERSTLEENGNRLLGDEQLDIREITRDGERWLVGTLWLPELQRHLMVEVSRADYTQSVQEQFYVSVGLGLVILLLSLGVLYPLTGSLVRPLVSFQRQLKEITHNLDLSKRIKTADRAELGDLADQTNQLLERLSQAIHAISRSAGDLSQVAERLAQTAGLSGGQDDFHQEASQTMAAAVEEMASSVAEITSTMEELSTSSTQIADHSQSVVNVANQTLECSRKGSTAMQMIQTRMQDIRSDNARSLEEIMTLGAKSKQISKVMELINTLAAQTKLIAFNAALEASSAGESGRRFSVVASEIRRLADSVTDSTQEIEGHTDEIQNAINRLVVTSEKGAASIEKGVEVSADTAKDLDALLSAASQTSSAAQQISLSTQQQKTASSQVVIALRDIDAASTRNAHSVRNITDISQDMIHMSGELNHLVQEFSLKPQPGGNPESGNQPSQEDGREPERQQKHKQAQPRSNERDPA